MKLTLESEMRMLLAESRSTLEKHHKASLSCGKPVPALVCLEKFETAFNRAGPSCCVAPLEHFYNTHRAGILSATTSDLWLRSRPHIQMGIGTNLLPKLVQHRLPIGEAYEAASALRVEAERLLKETESDSYANECRDLIRDEVILLHLLRSLYFMREETGASSDSDRLRKVISELETALQVPDHDCLVKATTTTTTPSVAEGSATAKAPMADLNSLIGSILPMFTGMLSSAGGKVSVPLVPPGESGLPTAADIGVIGSFASNPTVNAALGTMLQDIKKCDNPQEFITAVIGSIGKVAQTAVPPPQYNQTQTGLLLPEQIIETTPGQLQILPETEPVRETDD